MSDRDILAEQFELTRPRMQSVAYSMLGSVSEAEDAVQEAWLRLDRSDAAAIEDVRIWLTTVVGRICLALLIVLESLSPSERLAFVLHDIFALPFDEIGQILERSTEAARQLASRARRRVQAAPQPDRDVALQRQVVDAFLGAARTGDFDALLNVLAPDVVLRFDLGRDLAQKALVGAESVARHVLATAPRFIEYANPVLVNGCAGAMFGRKDHPISVLGFTVVDGRIAALDLIVDPAKLRHLSIES
jgi:DNA-directed RNA polymerase specialized sigma24 family protein